MERKLFFSKINNDPYRGECGMAWREPERLIHLSTISFGQLTDLGINARSAVEVDFDKELEGAKAKLRKNHHNIIAW